MGGGWWGLALVLQVKQDQICCANSPWDLKPSMHRCEGWAVRLSRLLALLAAFSAGGRAPALGHAEWQLRTMRRPPAAAQESLRAVRMLHMRAQHTTCICTCCFIIMDTAPIGCWPYHKQQRHTRPPSRSGCPVAGAHMCCYMHCAMLLGRTGTGELQLPGRIRLRGCRYSVPRQQGVPVALAGQLPLLARWLVLCLSWRFATAGLAVVNLLHLDLTLH